MIMRNCLDWLKSGLKRIINWNKHQSKISSERPNQYLDYLTDPGFQGIYRLFVLSFEYNEHHISYQRYFFPTIEIKDCIVMIDGKNIFWSAN